MEISTAYLNDSYLVKVGKRRWARVLAGKLFVQRTSPAPNLTILEQAKRMIVSTSYLVDWVIFRKREQLGIGDIAIRDAVYANLAM